MTTDHNVVTPRIFLAKTIKRLRELAGMTQDDLAVAIPASPSAVRSWEIPSRVPSPEVLGRMDAIFGTQGILLEVADDLVRPSVPLELFLKWLSLENEATSLLAYEASVFPGLLQKPEYARALLRFSRYSEEEIEKQVVARLKRQEIFDREDPTVFVVVLDEAVFHRVIGTPQVMCDQLAHVLQAARRRDIFIHVIPYGTGEYAGLAGAFAVATVRGKAYAYLDNAIAGDVRQHPEDVAEVMRRWESIRADALPRNASLEFIEKEAERWT